MVEYEPTVRAAGQSDVAALAQLMGEHLAYHAQYDARYLPRPDEDLAATWRRHLADRTRHVLVADGDGTPVGFALCRIEPWSDQSGALWRWLGIGRPRLSATGEIVDFYVAEGYRRCGVGRALVAAALDWFGQHGVIEVQLGVLVDNERGRAFWDAMGFRTYRLQMARRLNR